MTSQPTPKAAKRNPRRLAREFVVQALYQHLVGHNSLEAIDLFTRNLQGFQKADSVHFDAVFRGCVAEADALDTLITPALDRALHDISPCEHAILWMGAYELQHCLDIPWRVVLNEHIELAKIFGGTDGHKFVNGVLHQLARGLRPDEVSFDEPKNAE